MTTKQALEVIEHHLDSATKVGAFGLQEVSYIIPALMVLRAGIEIVDNKNEPKDLNKQVKP